MTKYTESVLRFDDKIQLRKYSIWFVIVFFFIRQLKIFCWLFCNFNMNYFISGNSEFSIYLREISNFFFFWSEKEVKTVESSIKEIKQNCIFKKTLRLRLTGWIWNVNACCELDLKNRSEWAKLWFFDKKLKKIAPFG